MKLPLRIAIDGPAASGKSTLAERLAQRLGYLYFDTGVMYRAATLAALRRLESLDDEQGVSALSQAVQIDVGPPSRSDGRKYDVYLDGEDITWEIRSPAVDANVSKVSAYPAVRQAMTGQQRRVGLRGNVVMVGRDIGTVVLPEAELKIYLDASVEERARRRYQEVQQRGEHASMEDILSSMRQRDEIDSNRVVAPLRPADDAKIIQTDHLDQDQVFGKILELLML